ncbi:response regulator transcription factor [Patulibacter americanus]|uniref:response regulator transcription factor n=1 Tax=Patulibacter americanus TaxID=588672 RepID=UPI0003B76024|nr:response regulator transcription factor [Patulibacter americanus]
MTTSSSVADRARGRRRTLLNTVLGTCAPAGRPGARRVPGSRSVLPADAATGRRAAPTGPADVAIAALDGALLRDGGQPSAGTPEGAAGPRAAPVRAFLLLGNLGPGPRVIAGALGATGRIVVAGASSDPVTGIEDAALLTPEVVVVDRFVGLTNGLAVARHLHGDLPHAAIVVRTPWPDADRHDAGRAGAAATVDIAATMDELAAAIVAADPRRAAA